MSLSKQNAITGCLLGTASGDALGLACEGLSRRRWHKVRPTLDGHKLLLLGRGMTSDDTEHTCMLSQSLIITGHDAPAALVKTFASHFAWRLRFWLLGPHAGIGMATLRAIIQWWLVTCSVNAAGRSRPSSVVAPSRHHTDVGRYHTPPRRRAHPCLALTPAAP